jgi:hypothetical protein
LILSRAEGFDFVRSREIWFPFLEESSERFLGFGRADSNGEFLVLELNRVLE